MANPRMGKLEAFWLQTMQLGDGATPQPTAYGSVSSGPAKSAPQETACGSGGSGPAESTPVETACGSKSSGSGVAESTPPETACGSGHSGLAETTPAETPPETACGSSGSRLAESTPEAVACGSGGATVGGPDVDCNLSKRALERLEKGHVRRRAGRDQEYYEMWYKTKRSNWNWQKPSEKRCICLWSQQVASRGFSDECLKMV